MDDIISTEQIAHNTERFNELVFSIDREGFNPDALISFLEDSDFYTAPASTKYHNSFQGGLVAHCLHVYDNMVSIFNAKQIPGVFPESLVVVALFHELYKRNFYTEYYRNKKEYSNIGKKTDDLGRFDWVSVKEYTVSENRFTVGTHGDTSYYLLSAYMPLAHDEVVALFNATTPYEDLDLSLLRKYPLLTLLRAADEIACYVDDYYEDVND